MMLIFILLLLFFIYLHLSMFFILLLHLHLISRLLCHVTGTLPWLLRPVKTSTSSDLYPNYFWLPFLFHLQRALRFWVGIFLPTGVFYLTLLPNIFGTFPTFWHNLLLSRFHWEPAVTFLKVAGLHTDPWNTDPVHLFVCITVIHNLLYILSLYLCYQYCKSFTCAENFDKISSHTI